MAVKDYLYDIVELGGSIEAMKETLSNAIDDAIIEGEQIIKDLKDADEPVTKVRNRLKFVVLLNGCLFGFIEKEYS